MSDLRSDLIRIASELPPGDKTRTKLLRTLQASLGKKVNEKGLIIGYGAGPGGEAERELMMFGPLLSTSNWTKAMIKATPYGYNEFSADRVGGFFRRYGIKKVHPAREYSVAAYASLDGLSVDEVLEFVKNAGLEAYADEVSVEPRPGARALGGPWDMAELRRNLPESGGRGLWARLWWD